MIRQTERQMVQLALAVARRVVHREVSLDADLLIAMARVALDRLGETRARHGPAASRTTSRPPAPARVAQLAGSNVTVVADPRVGRGGCRVESDIGISTPASTRSSRRSARALLGEPETSDGQPSKPMPEGLLARALHRPAAADRHRCRRPAASSAPSAC